MPETPPFPRARARSADVVGLGLILFVLLDYFRPALLAVPTIAAGGDTTSHYPTFVRFHQQWLPHLRLHGWEPGGFLGHPQMLYYFPLPFLLMSALAPLLGMPVAFKVGTALGVYLMPLFVYLAFRAMSFRFPTPLLGAASCALFLFLEENPIWGGTMASTLTGEFSYTYGTGLAVLFLGVMYRSYARGGSAWLPAALLALTALAHGYAVLWAGLSASYFLYGSRRPWWTLRVLLSVALLAFALAGFWLLPLLSGWGWTTSYHDAWITVGWQNLFPVLLWPLFAAALLGLGFSAFAARFLGGADHRLLYLFHAVVMAAALGAAGSALGIVDIRFVPFAQLAACLLGGASIGLAVQAWAAADLAAAALVIGALLLGDAHSKVLRYWIDWNYTGVEAKELWPAFRAMADAVRGSVADPRVAVEYGKDHERAGTIRMYETLPFFAGRSTLEGVSNQASISAHAVYYVSSELGATSPNPFRSREYSGFDLDAAFAHLRLFNVDHVVALSSVLKDALALRPGVAQVADVPPFRVFRLQPGSEPFRYVEPLRHAPVRSSPRGWREKSYDWFMRKPLSPALLVFTEDPRFEVAERDPWLAPPLVPLPGEVHLEEEVEDEAITIRTDRPGHPLLVKVSFHPRWKAEGAFGPYLVSPALMMVVPREREVRLTYGRDGSDRLGAALTGSTLLGGLLALAWRRRRPAAQTPEAGPPWRIAGRPKALDWLALRFYLESDGAGALPAPSRRWGGVIPAALVVLLLSGRLFSSETGPRGDAAALERLATEAQAAGRRADAAEYARQALRFAAPEARPGLLALRGESLLAAGEAQLAAESFRGLHDDASARGYRAQALSGLARAHQALGQPEQAELYRAALRSEFPDNPWTAAAR